MIRPRREMTAAIAGLLCQTGATVLFSSHILSDVERLADEVCLILGGRTIFHLPLDFLTERSRRLVIRGPASAESKLAELPGPIRIRREEEAMVLTLLEISPGWREKLQADLGSPLDLLFASLGGMGLVTLVDASLALMSTSLLPRPI